MNKLLGQSAFWMVNKAIAKHFKCNNTALLLSYLIDSEEYYETKGTLGKDGFFFRTSADIEKDVNISYHKQKKCIDKLKAEGFIETILKGLPAKIHFRVVQNKISSFLNTVIEKTPILELEKFETNKNIVKKKIQKEEKENSPTPDFLKKNREKAKQYAENKTLYFKNEEKPNDAMESYMVANILPLVKGEMYFKRFVKYNSLTQLRKKELVKAFCLENCKNLEGWGDNKMDCNTRLLFHFANWLVYKITENDTKQQSYKITTT